jgi:TetR/AcrR family transcriptional regulator, regulator of autoinduction and epiphytic fitness
MKRSPSIFDGIASSLPLPSTRDAILSAASAVFIRHGFEGASMELVAQATGVARRTLYNQFPNGKESLFVAVVERMWQAFPYLDMAKDEIALADPEIGFRRIGESIAALWGPPLAIQFLRMLIGESSRFPDVMQSFSKVGKGPAVAAVTDYIAELGRRGALRVGDPELASQQFLGLIDEPIIWARVMGDDRALTKAKIKRIIEQAISIFLDHYRAQGPSTPGSSS